MSIALDTKVSNFVQDMEPDQLDMLEALREFEPDYSPMDEDNDEDIRMDDVLSGRIEIDISHAGGEFQEAIHQEIEEEHLRQNPKRADWRTRRDRIERRTKAFDTQMESMVDMYMKWVGEGEAPPLREDTGEYQIRVVDILDSYVLDANLDSGGNGVAAALIKQGLFPCAPFNPSVVITTRTLELFRTAHVRCPHLSIQPFVKTLCDLRGEPYKPYLCQQFTICYDLYLDVKRQTERRVLESLGRDSSWRMKHVCPACTYELVGEDELMYRMLMTMDGGESLRRVIGRADEPEVDPETGDRIQGKSKERTDHREAGEGYFVDRDRVDQWAKAKVANLLPTDAVPGEETPCSDRWKNMINDITSKMWGIFDETGIFVALCRHGFVLILADMIRSGELAKYPLALVDILLDTYGEKLGLGYDVGCHFEATIRNSKLSERAKENMLKMLVGAFHGHAHNRLCQLRFLATYVEGLGLEDLEGCERFFSGSNGMAKAVRYSSRFHRQQEITNYIKHHDNFETYANLGEQSKFLCNNYTQALSILKTETALQSWMEKQGVESYDQFRLWLKEEQEWLLAKKAAAANKEVTLEMEYVQKLVNLSVSQTKVSTLRGNLRAAKARDNNYDPSRDTAAKRGLRHAEEVLRRDLEAVQHLEEKLDISPRWTAASPEWVASVKLLKEKKFMDALNALEFLIVERIFELTKVNRSGTDTGYKMRKHIAHALSARSQAVKNAISRYNVAATSLEPPAPQLTWEEVVEYAFLADFDFLRATDGELNSKPWTKPACRLAMDSYFKILRAREEIKRLNVEIQRVVSWINDEDEFLRRREQELRDKGDINMAVLVKKYRRERARFDMSHMDRFHKLSKTSGFTGSILPGLSKEVKEQRKADRKAKREAARAREQAQEDSGEDGRVETPGRSEEEDEEEEVTADMAAGWTPPLGAEVERESDDEDEGEEEREKELAEMVYELARLSVDGKGPQMEAVDGEEELDA
ncbi:hypothetical protein DFH06DRAFT_1121808 [Mycena polygramma]|nr:hypothetical protein DFH06DRAFT_1121808 [Mycena polygramma]